MILADTSIWIDHLRGGDAALADLLNQDQVCAHPYVIGELALGNLKSRALVLELLQALPQLSRATDDELLVFIERHALAGRGIGLIDAHLLASVRLHAGAKLWTRDKRLQNLATELGLHIAPMH